MKKILIIIFLSAFICSIFANDVKQSAGPDKSLQSPFKGNGFIYSTTRDAPTYEFVIQPTSIMPTYYDYQPGSYCSLPLRIQPEISQPYGHPAGGAYVAFHSEETANATRRVYYAYIDAEGNVTAVDPIATWDIREGYPGTYIDPITADPMVVYHLNMDADPTFEDVLAYDLYHMMGSAGLWLTPFEVIDNSELATAGILPFADDDFEWPYVFISDSSPLGGDYRRVYVSSENFKEGHGPVGDPSENVLIAYADFNTNDLDMQSTLSWSYRTIEQMDAWNAEDPEWRRPLKGVAVYENIIIYFGYVIDNDSFVSDMFALVNENYGEGPFEYYSESYLFDQWNPLNEDGTAYLYSDEVTPMTPYIVRQEHVFSSHMNVILKDNNTKATWTGEMGITFDALDGNGPGYYYPEWCQSYPKEFVFDLITHEFSFKDLYIEGANPTDNIPMVPWDLDEDGVVDSFDENGDPEWVWNWPVYWPVGDDAFHENTYKTAKNENWLVSVWADGTKAKRFFDGDNSFVDWEAIPEVAIIISADNGETWSEPIFLNANDTPELANQIPCYVYPGDVIEIISNTPGNYHGKVHLFYLDDNDFGSTINGNGLNNGGQIMYAALDIEFPAEWNPEQSYDNNEIPAIGLLSQNYPNPFNPSTTISFSLNTETTEDTEIIIYNMKGQKVKELLSDQLSAGQHSVVWDGTNDNHKKVSSGVYFYRMTAGDYISTKKMILMK